MRPRLSEILYLLTIRSTPLRPTLITKTQGTTHQPEAERTTPLCISLYSAPSDKDARILAMPEDAGWRQRRMSARARHAGFPVPLKITTKQAWPGLKLHSGFTFARTLGYTAVCSSCLVPLTFGAAFKLRRKRLMKRSTGKLKVFRCALTGETKNFAGRVYSTARHLTFD